MKCLAVVLEVMVTLPRGDSLGSGHLTPAVRWFAGCHLAQCQLGELDLMLEPKLVINVEKMRLKCGRLESRLRETDVRKAGERLRGKGNVWMRVDGVISPLT